MPGSISAVTPVGTYNAPAISGEKGAYGFVFSPSSPSGIPGIVNNGTVLAAGTYTLTLGGGADVGAATASINFPLTFAWTNDAAVTSVDRSLPLTITWSGGTEGAQVLVEVQSSASTPVSGTLLCHVDATLGTYTVSASLLSALPPSFTLSGIPEGAVSVLENMVGEFSASGLDFGTITYSDGINKGAVPIQ